MTEKERRSAAEQQLEKLRAKHVAYKLNPDYAKVGIGYTKKEAEKLIEKIKKSKQDRFDFENGDGVHFTSYTKEEMIEMIKRNIRDD